LSFFGLQLLVIVMFEERQTSQWPKAVNQRKTNITMAKSRKPKKENITMAKSRKPKKGKHHNGQKP
jgi:hypothetical protein